MKFLDLDKEYEQIEWKKALEQVFEEKSFINGSSVRDFEAIMGNYFYVSREDCSSSLGVSSGTDAITVAMMAIMEQHKIENPVVLTTPYTFISTIESPIKLGAKIIFCDIKSDFNVNMDLAKEIISKEKIDIFIPVHLFGLPCDIDEEIISLCKAKNTFIIEDACQSFGSDINNQKVGTFGDIGCFSFFPSKNLGCAGDGGLIVTNCNDLYDKCEIIRNHGSSDKYYHETLGGNFRLDSIQAAILSAKIPYLELFIESRKINASIYKEWLSVLHYMDKSELILPNNENSDITHTYNQYVIRVSKNRKRDLMEYLKSCNIPTADYYPLCVFDQPCFKNYNFNKEDCKEAIKATQESVALPIAYLSWIELKYIIKKIDIFHRQFY